MADSLLTTLPQELIIKILRNLDAVSLAHCAMLHFDGLIDGGTSSPNSELLESLLRWRRAWLAFNWKGFDTHNMRYSCKAYEFVGGAFASTDRDHLEIAWLPTATKAKGHTLQRASTGISIRDFTLDPAQDLIVLLENNAHLPPLTDTRTIDIHIRTISTDENHPLARQSVLHYTVPPSFSLPIVIHRAHLEIVRNILVTVLYLHSSWHGPRVLIWDWTTSELITDSSLWTDSLLPSPNFEFGLLTSIFCLFTCPSNSGSIRLYRLVRSSGTFAPAIHLATLHLPPITLQTTVDRIYPYAGPIEAMPLSSTPFMVNDDDRLHVFTVVYNHPGVGNDEFNLFVHQRVFMKYASKQAPLEAQPLDIPWEEWGPPNTRIICPARVASDGWSRYVHGQRVILPGHIDIFVNDDDDNGQLEESMTSVELLDFSLAAVSAAKSILRMSASSVKSNSGTLLQSSKIRDWNSTFKDDIETHLPCVSVKRDLKRMYLAHMVHAGGIVGLYTDNNRLLLHTYAV